MTNYPFSATALAVLTALTLTACGGRSGFDGPISSTTIWDRNQASTASATNNSTSPASTTNSTDTDTTNTTADNTDQPAKPNQDSDKFTTASSRPADSAIKSDTLPKQLHTSELRNDLHQKVSDAYGTRFDTTFRYNTTFTNQATQKRTESVKNGFSIRTTGLGNDYQAYDMDETLETNIDGVKYTGERKSRVKLYQQDNSLVLGMQTLSGTIFDSNNTKKTDIKGSELRIDHLKGNPFVKPTKDEMKSAIEDRNSKAEVLSTSKIALVEEKKQKTELEKLLTSTKADDTATKLSLRKEIDASKKKIAELEKTLAKTELEYQRAVALVEKNDKIDEIFTKNGGQEFSYKGKAFDKDSTGELAYHINFNTLAGHGEITNLSTGKINLNEANIQTINHTNPDKNIVFGEGESNQTSLLGIQGVAQFDNGRKDGKYTLGIFGDYAEEVAGFVTEDNVNTVGFGGKR